MLIPPGRAVVWLLAGLAGVGFPLPRAWIELTVNKWKSTCLVGEAPAPRCLGLPWSNTTCAPVTQRIFSLSAFGLFKIYF